MTDNENILGLAMEGFGSCRVAYVDFTVYQTIYLTAAYPKSEKDNLSAKERNEIKKVIPILEKGLEKQGTRK